jgi:multiple sugar transport system ATP-binding protein
MASVTLEKLYKNYGKVQAVRGIDMHIADGEFMAFLGPSGCGKSSTMRTIAGLEEISGGKIYFNEQCVNRVRPRERGVAMAFETYALYPTINVYENLAFPLRAAKWSTIDLDARVKEIAGILEITDLLDRMPQGLSSGQAQRVGLARALTRKPEVFVLDEPISHLDTRQRTRMRAYLKRLHIELGHTMIYVTHDQEEAMAMADRITIMKDGVAGFMGEPAMNFLRCRYVENGGRYLQAASTDQIRVPLPARMDALAQQGQIPQDVTLGIRPFYANISFSKDEAHTIPAGVFIVEPLGDSTVVTVQVADVRMQIVTNPDFWADIGQSVWLAFEPDRIRLFDDATGNTLTRRLLLVFASVPLCAALCN